MPPSLSAAFLYCSLFPLLRADRVIACSYLTPYLFTLTSGPFYTGCGYAQTVPHQFCQIYTLSSTCASGCTPLLSYPGPSTWGKASWGDILTEGQFLTPAVSGDYNGLAMKGVLDGQVINSGSVCGTADAKTPRIVLNVEVLNAGCKSAGFFNITSLQLNFWDELYSMPPTDSAPSSALGPAVANYPMSALESIRRLLLSGRANPQRFFYVRLIELGAIGSGVYRTQLAAGPFLAPMKWVGGAITCGSGCMSGGSLGAAGCNGNPSCGNNVANVLALASYYNHKCVCD